MTHVNRIPWLGRFGACTPRCLPQRSHRGPSIAWTRARLDELEVFLVWPNAATSSGEHILVVGFLGLLSAPLRFLQNGVCPFPICWLAMARRPSSLPLSQALIRHGVTMGFRLRSRCDRRELVSHLRVCRARGEKRRSMAKRNPWRRFLSTFEEDLFEEHLPSKYLSCLSVSTSTFQGNLFIEHGTLSTI